MEPKKRQGQCPTCKKHVTFTHAGQQSVPEKVAQALGYPELLNLWHCQHCHTTVLDPSLAPAS